MSTNRVEKVNSLLEHEVGKIIRRDFTFAPDILVTLTRVETSSNMIDAKAYISVFPEEKLDGILNALQKSVYDIQYEINRILKMRPIPKIRFIKEKEIASAARIEELLAKDSKYLDIEKE
ncbi:MAG: 30S ribosome-binding factor RbfA [Candidatus Staskawiczbacteria bacterium]|jgi:ribosome-binding factor A